MGFGVGCRRARGGEGWAEYSLGGEGAFWFKEGAVHCPWLLDQEGFGVDLSCFRVCFLC